LALIAGVGLVLVILDFRWPGDRVRPRLLAAALGFLVMAGCVAPLAVKAVDELRHPPAVTDSNLPFDAPPGFGPPGFPPPQGEPPTGPAGPGSAADAPMMPMAPPDLTTVPAALRERYERLQNAVAEHLRAGQDPRLFWDVPDEMRFRRMLDHDETNQASQFLDAAVSRLDPTARGNP
jgi:hypothetical protein